MNKPELNIDKRPKVAVYSTISNQRSRRAVELLHLFCAFNGLHGMFYLDKKAPKEGQPSAWQRLLNDINEGKFDAVITWLEAPGMQEYCESNNTKFVEVDPFYFYQSLRSKADTIKIIEL